MKSLLAFLGSSSLSAPLLPFLGLWAPLWKEVLSRPLAEADASQNLVMTRTSVPPEFFYVCNVLEGQGTDCFIEGLESDVAARRTLSLILMDSSSFFKDNAL